MPSAAESFRSCGRPMWGGLTREFEVLAIGINEPGGKGR